MNSSTRNELMEKLYKNEEFEKLESNRDRVKFILDRFMSYEQLRESVKLNLEQAKQKTSKSVALANCFKQEAECFLQDANGSVKPQNQEESLQKALVSYGKAIIYTPFEPSHIDHLTKLYIRKSRIHFQLKQYEEALYSVDVALNIRGQFHRKTDTSFELLILKVNCLKMLKRYQEAIQMLNQITGLENIQEVTSMSEEKLQEMRISIQKLVDRTETSDMIESKSEWFSYQLDPRCNISNSPIVGRHFLAKENIPKGTVILREKPYSIIMESDVLHKRCSNCFIELKHRLYPCQYCTELIFCDAKCFEEAYQVFHRHECGLVSLLRHITSPSFHVFRMISRVGPLDAYHVEKEKHGYTIENYLAEPNQRIVPEVRKSQEEKREAYKMSSILWDHDSKHGQTANVHHSVVGLELAILLDLVHSIRRQKPSDEFFLDFIDMIIVDTRRIIFNVFGWQEYNQDWSLKGQIANCQCLVGSLINHSCVPNTNWEFQNGEIRFTTNQLIEKDQEITITYGPNKDIAYEKRQERLNHYFFACKCRICLRDATSGNALKCPSCLEGPIPFETSVNQEPVLSGQCLLCFEKCTDFEVKVKQFKESIETLKHLARVSQLISPTVLKSLLLEAMKHLNRLSTLIIMPNHTLISLSLTITNILQRFSHSVSLADKLEFGHMIDQMLPVDGLLSTAFLKSGSITALHFWLDHFIDLFDQSGESMSLEDRCDLFNTLIRFQHRARYVLQTFRHQENDQVILEMIDHHIDYQKDHFNKLRELYGHNLEFRTET